MKETEAAMKTLKDKKCASGTTCKTDEECEKAYFVVQAHHDHCAADEVPKAVAADLHDFESSCSSCHIAKKLDKSLPTCDEADCAAGDALQAAFDYLEDESNGCASDCSANECGKNFQMLRAAHDACEIDDLPQAVEEGIHDFEDACAAQECNVGTEEPDLECHMEDSAASTLTVGTALALMLTTTL